LIEIFKKEGSEYFNQTRREESYLLKKFSGKKVKRRVTRDQLRVGGVRRTIVQKKSEKKGG